MIKRCLATFVAAAAVCTGVAVSGGAAESASAEALVTQDVVLVVNIQPTETEEQRCYRTKRMRSDGKGGCKPFSKEGAVPLGGSFKECATGAGSEEAASRGGNAAGKALANTKKSKSFWAKAGDGMKSAGRGAAKAGKWMAGRAAGAAGAFACMGAGGKGVQ